MPPRFLVDVMCGRVVSYLRMCGYDTLYAGDRDLESDDEIRTIADREERTILTRDVDLAARTDDAVLLESRDHERQLVELRRAGIDLELADDPSRCGACNGRLERVETPTETPEFAPDPGDESVWRCRKCGQHFWKGSHWDRVDETLARVSNVDGSDHDDRGSNGSNGR